MKIISLFLVIILLGCAQPQQQIEKHQTESKLAQPKLIYQLQNTNFNELKQSDADILVIDIDDSEFTSQQIKELTKEKIVLSYLSIGEAESYRSYWQDDWKPDNPSFVDKENPEWEENYKVKFWEEEWQNIIIEQLDKIIDKGYSGAYLDLIDSYEYYAYLSSINSRQEMIDFVILLSMHARSKNPNFLILPQNALELTQEENYLAAIDGVGKEDTWYDNNKKLNQEDIDYETKLLKSIKNQNKLTLVIDYPTKEEKICDFYQLAQNFSPYHSNRELDKINIPC